MKNHSTLLDFYKNNTLIEKPKNNNLLSTIENLQQIFKFGACFDFSCVLSEILNKDVIEIQSGDYKQNNIIDGDEINVNIHRAICHDKNILIDSTGYTTVEIILKSMQQGDIKKQYEWFGKVDSDMFHGGDEVLIAQFMKDIPIEPFNLTQFQRLADNYIQLKKIENKQNPLKL